MPLQPCPYPVHAEARLSSLAQLPQTVRAVLGEMADAGQPFQVSDSLPPGPHPPFRRFVDARGSGCTLAVSFEQGGIAHTWATRRFVLKDGRWTSP